MHAHALFSMNNYGSNVTEHLLDNADSCEQVIYKNNFCATSPHILVAQLH